MDLYVRLFILPVFALLNGDATGAALEAGGAAITRAADADAAFAFRMTFFCGALVSVIAHVLAWQIPEASLRGHGEPSLGKAEA